MTDKNNTSGREANFPPSRSASVMARTPRRTPSGCTASVNGIAPAPMGPTPESSVNNV